MVTIRKPAQRSPFPFESRLIYQGNHVWIGRFRAHPSHEQFYTVGEFRGPGMITFPRTCVELCVEGLAPLVSSPNLAVFYNNGQVYSRQAVDKGGDRCEWFTYAPNVLADAMHSFKPNVEWYDPNLFDLHSVFLTRDLFLLQRSIVEHIYQQTSIDRLWVDEMSLVLLDGLCTAQLCQQERDPIKRKRGTKQAHRQLASALQELLVRRFTERLTLEGIAAELHVSPFHAARIFRKQFGCTIHSFLEQLRLRTAVERLPEYRQALTTLAHDVGYTSHSHFTQAFRRAFHLPPSRMSFRSALAKLETLPSLLHMQARAEAHPA